MNIEQTEIKNQIIEILPSIIERLKTAENFVIQETPIVIQELLTWNFVRSLTIFIISILLIVSTVLIAKKLIDKTRVEDGSIDFDCLIPIIFISSGIIILFTGMFFFHWDWLKIWIAPRVWLIEYATNLVR